MRKIYVSILSLLFAGMSAAAVEVPYSSPIAISASDFDEGWTVINANGDTRAWAPVEEAGGETSYMAQYNYAYSTPADDHLVSPPLNLKGGSAYKLSFKMKTKADLESLTVYVASANDADQLKGGTVLFDWEEKSDQNLTTYTVPVTVSEDGEYYISWYAHSPKNKNKIFICDMKIALDEFIPSGVTDLTATPASNRELKCDLTWILPTASTLGDPFTESQTIDLIEIFRDDSDTPIASLTEPVTEFSDTADTGLTSGCHVYSVVVTVGGVKSPAVSVGPTVYIGPVAAQDIPYSIELDSQDNFDMFSRVAGNSTDIAESDQWHFASSYIGKYAAHTRTAKNLTEDSWLISPPLKVEKAGNFTVTFKGSVSNMARAKKLEAYFGDGSNPETMILKAESFDLTETPSDYSFAFNAATPGTYYVAFHAAAEGDTYAQEYPIFNLNVEEAEQQAMKPAPVTGLKARAALDQTCNINVSWVNPTSDFAGSPITADQYAVKVFVNDAEEPSVVVEGDDIVTEGRQAVTIPVDNSGIFTIKVLASSIEDP